MANQPAAKSKRAPQRAKTSAAKDKSSKDKKSALKQEFREVAGVDSRKDYVRFTIAILLMVAALFMLLSMVSNIFTGSEDQAEVLSGTVGQASNYGGKLGAYCAYYFMNNLFGVLSIFFPIYLLAIVLKLLLKDASPIRLWLLFLHFSLIVVLGSVDANYIQEYFLPDSWKHGLSFDLGGMHGRTVLAYMTEYVGSTISGIILFLLTLGYLGYWFTQIFIWIFKGLHRLSAVFFGTPSSGDAEAGEAAVIEEPAAEPSLPDPLEAAVDTEAAGGLVPTADQSAAETGPTEETAAPTIRFSLTDTVEEHPEQSGTAPLMVNGEAPPSPLPTVIEGSLPISMLHTGQPADPQEQSVPLTIIEQTEEQKSAQKTAADVAALPPYDPRLDLSHYKFPPLSLLEKHDTGNVAIDMAEQNDNKERIINVLRNFGVDIGSIAATIGPTVTLYEIVPAKGIRIQRYKSLEADIALSLAAPGIRIFAPIPGKTAIGIEVPNRKPQIVSMESIINTQKFRDTKFELPIALGKTITNEVFMVDLAKIPHLLVAGATGQGKSVGLNVLITSLLYKKHPSELKIVMVDPKKVEFSMYQPLLKHFLAQVPDSEEPVITDVKKVIQTLKSLCQEMDDRYDLLKAAHCRNLKEYNAKFTERRLNPEQGHHFLPYIVVIIDEFGDLIMTAGKEVELPIARIAQLARAVGIHMVIATQSPRTTIITGKIKANFPGRVAFRVTNGIESRTILDDMGANNLIGRGDMLFRNGSETTRVQCAFIDTPEIEAITEYIHAQQGYPVPFELPLVAEDGVDTPQDAVGGGGSSFENIARFVVNSQQGSTSKIQRSFSIGFNRAGRIMDQLEEAGIVGPVNGSKPREVYVHSEEELNAILASLKAQGKHFD